MGGIKISTSTNPTPPSSNIFVVKVGLGNSLWPEVDSYRGEDTVGELLDKGRIMGVDLLLVLRIVLCPVHKNDTVANTIR